MKISDVLVESTSLKTTIKAIANDIGEPVREVYETLKPMARKFYDNKGTMRGFGFIAGGVGGRWMQRFYINKLQNELHDLIKYSPKTTAELKEFLAGTLFKGKLQMDKSFGELANSLPEILFKIGQRLESQDLMRSATAWQKARSEYEKFVESFADEEEVDTDVIDKPKKDKDNSLGQQLNQSEKIVNDILNKLPSKISGDIRNVIARSPNKLQALMAELNKRGIKPPMLDDIQESLDENLKKWFKEKWVRFGPDGKIRGDCARGDDSEGKPKCLPQSKAHSLGKKGRATAASRKRREDPNPERKGAAKNVRTK